MCATRGYVYAAYERTCASTGRHTISTMYMGVSQLCSPKTTCARIPLHGCTCPQCHY